MSLGAKHPVPRPSVRSHNVADETVLVDGKRDQAFSLNMSARAIWELCDGSRTVRAISEELADASSEDFSTVHDDVEETIRRFVSMDIVVLSDTEPEPSEGGADEG